VVLTVAVVAILLTISALALDKPDVRWREGAARCPHCGTLVEAYSRRCKACREEYEWTAAGDEDSPLSPWSLSALEDAALRERVKGLGHEPAAAIVAAATGLSKEAAREYLDQVGLGRCGWCGGTGRDLDRPAAKPLPCPACLGRGRCVACDGDRRIRVGDEGAARDYARYVAQLRDISSRVSLEAQREEVRRLTDAFVERWHGTEEATRVVFWPEWTVDGRGPRLVERSRHRLDQALDALGVKP
jgi:hypothetical protein